MLVLLKRFALFAFMLVLPLQGLAAAVAPVMCLAGGDHHHAMDLDSPDDSHHPSHSHQHGKSDSGKTSDASAHLECHHVFSAAPVSLPSLGAGDLPVFHTTISSAATLYIPELPQRPPRT